MHRLIVSGCEVQMDYIPSSSALMDTVLSFSHLPFPITVDLSPRINSSLNLNMQPPSKRSGFEWKS